LNEENEKPGDINEVLLEQPSEATGVVIGVGGFLFTPGFGTAAVPARLSSE
jgi:hypothetical protein